MARELRSQAWGREIIRLASAGSQSALGCKAIQDEYTEVGTLVDLFCVTGSYQREAAILEAHGGLASPFLLSFNLLPSFSPMQQEASGHGSLGDMASRGQPWWYRVKRRRMQGGPQANRPRNLLFRCVVQ